MGGKMISDPWCRSGQEHSVVQMWGGVQINTLLHTIWHWKAWRICNWELCDYYPLSSLSQWSILRCSNVSLLKNTQHLCSSNLLLWVKLLLYRLRLSTFSIYNYFLAWQLVYKSPSITNTHTHTLSISIPAHYNPRPFWVLIPCFTTHSLFPRSSSSNPELSRGIAMSITGFKLPGLQWASALCW